MKYCETCKKWNEFHQEKGICRSKIMTSIPHESLIIVPPKFYCIDYRRKDENKL